MGRHYAQLRSTLDNARGAAAARLRDLSVTSAATIQVGVPDGVLAGVAHMQSRAVSTCCDTMRTLIHTTVFTAYPCRS
jgi:hypothetical protein